MKKMKNIALFMVILILLTACNANTTAQKDTGKPSKVENEKKTDIQVMPLSHKEIVVERELIDYTNPENAYAIYDKWSNGEKTLRQTSGYEGFYQDYWKFSSRIFEKLVKEDNIIFSPLSAYIPLSELSYAMDDSAPKNELIELLRKNAANEYWTKKLMDQFRVSGYLMGSSIWIADNCTPDIGFLKENLTSDIYRIDFAAPGAEEKQIAWINKWTKGFLSDQIQKDDLGNQSPAGTELACRLIGTAYVKDNWEKEFFGEPKEDTFYRADGTEEKVPFLHGYIHNTVYLKKDGYEMAKIPMANGEMIIVLPEKDSSVEKLLQKDILMEVANEKNWENANVEVKMPDFTQSSRLDLLEILNELGYQEITTLQEGYSKLVGKHPDGRDIKCMVSKVLQQSKIEVKKEGIQAAAYTQVDVVKESAMIIEEVKEINMEVNRPYLYILTDRSNLPSFIGINQAFTK